MASKSGVLAGKAYVLLEAVDGTAAVLRNVESRFIAWGSRLQAVGMRIFARGLTAMVPAALSTNIFRQFDDIMRRVEARTQGTSAEMKGLRNQAIGLGKSSAFSAREIAGLQDVLAQRKFDRTQIAEMTPSIAMLGRAAGGGDAPAQDLLNAADLVSQAIMMYELSAKDAAKVSDIFTAAANESNFALEDLIISMANAGPIAHQYGMSLEETLAIMMVMRDLSIDPSIAGTGLRNLFIKASDKKAVEDFNKLMSEMVGATLEFKDAMGNLASPADILFNFDKLTKQLGTAERGHLLAELFGLRAITPATAVSANAKNFTDALGVLLRAAGETEDAYKKMEGGIGGVFRRLANTLESVALIFGDILEEPVMALGNSIVKLNLSIGQWLANNQNLVVGITALLASLLPLGAALVAAGAAFKVLAFIIAPVRMALGLMIGSIKLLVAWLIVPVVTAVYGVIAALVKTAITIITTVVPAFISLGIQALTTFASIAMAALGWVVPAIMAASIAVFNLVASFVAFAPELALALLILAPFFLLVAAGAFSVKEEVQSLNETVNETANAATNVQSTWTSAWNSITQAVSDSINFIIERTMQLVNTISQTMKGVTTALLAGDTELAMTIGLAGLNLAWLQVKDTAIDAWGSVVAYIKETINELIIQFNNLRISFLQWSKEQFNFTNTLLGDPIGVQIRSIELDNKLLAQRRPDGKDTQADAQRAQEIADAQNQLTSLNISAENKKRMVAAIREAEMNNIPEIGGVPVPAIKNLIRRADTTVGGVGGAKGIEGVQKSTMEGAKAAYENAQNRLEAIQNKELKTLENIDNKLGDVNARLQGILEKPETQGV